MVITRLSDCVPKNRNMKKKDLKVLVRDPINNISEFLVDEARSKEHGKSKGEVLECSARSSVSLPIPFSRLETNSYSPSQPENQSRNDINKGASPLFRYWEAKSQQSSPSNSSPFSDSLSDEAKNNNDDLDRYSQSERSYFSTSWDKEREARKFPKLVACTPRIRGKPAFEDVLTMILCVREKDLKRLAACYMVSKFTPRGRERLQYMLRIRSLERCIAIQERQKLVKRYSRASGLMNLRDRYKKNTGKVKNTVETRISSMPVSSRVENGLTKPEMEGKVPEEGDTMEKVIVKEIVETKNTSVMSIAEKVNMWDAKERSYRRRNTEKPKIEGKASRKFINDVEIVERNKETRKKEEVSSFEEGKSREMEEYKIHPQEVTTMISFEEETASHVSRGNGQEEKSTRGDEETWKDEKQEEFCFILESPNSWEEKEMEYEDYSGGSEYNDDWLIDILQPQSHWDDLRKQREKEVMMNKDPKKDCLRRMIKKRTVSTLLASDFRKEIDKIMILCADKRFRVGINPEEEEDSEEWMVECSTRYQQTYKTMKERR